MSKRVKSIEHVVNHATGEVLTTSKEFTIQVPAGDEFFMVFLKHLGNIYQLKNVTDIQVMAFMMESCEFNRNSVSFTAGKRKELMNKLGIGTQNITNSLKRLKSLNLITGEDGDYTIDAELMWKGSTKERERFLTDKGIDVRINFKK